MLSKERRQSGIKSLLLRSRVERFICLVYLGPWCDIKNDCKCERRYTADSSLKGDRLLYSCNLCKASDIKVCALMQFEKGVMGFERS